MDRRPLAVRLLFEKSKTKTFELGEYVNVKVGFPA